MDERNLLDPRTFQNKPKLTLRAGLPSEYLRRWAVLKDVFRLPTNYLGRAGEEGMAVEQPFINQKENEQEEIDDVIQFMEAHGFAPVDEKLIARAMAG